MPAPSFRRCSLTVPGGSERMLRKAETISVDELVLDIEDGVAVSEKVAARAAVVAALTGSALAGRQIAVRINSIGTPWCDEDIAVIGGVAREGLTLVVPKVESAADVAFVTRLLAQAERGRPRRCGLQCLIETAKGLAKVAEIAAAAERVESLVIGYGDLASSLGYGADADWSAVRHAVLLAARVNGLMAIDGPFFALGTAEAHTGLTRAAATAAANGFDGKWAIHPGQIDTITACFTPAEPEVKRARAIIGKLDEVQAAGKGIALLDGAMIDEAMRQGAMRILARAGVSR